MAFTLYEVSKRSILLPTTIRIDDGYHIVITGKNGSGKTTLLRTLSGICIPDLGKIAICGASFKFPMRIFEYRRYFRIIRKHVFYAEGSSMLYENLTIKQNMEYYLGLDKYDTTKIREIFQFLNINEDESKIIRSLSLGTKQKLVAALALLSQKEILILDEPTLGIDEEVSQRFMIKLISLPKTIIVSTHDKEYYPLFDKIYTFAENGEIKERGDC